MNLAGVLIELFLVSRIIKYLGVGVGILILPCLSLGAYGLLAFYPMLNVVRWAKTAENSTDYSLNNTVRNMLFLAVHSSAEVQCETSHRFVLRTRRGRADRLARIRGDDLSCPRCDGICEIQYRPGAGLVGIGGVDRPRVQTPDRNR